jgi:hypothetical protein
LQSPIWVTSVRSSCLSLNDLMILTSSTRLCRHLVHVAASQYCASQWAAGDRGDGAKTSMGLLQGPGFIQAFSSGSSSSSSSSGNGPVGSGLIGAPKAGTEGAREAPPSTSGKEQETPLLHSIRNRILVRHSLRDHYQCSRTRPTHTVYCSAGAPRVCRPIWPLTRLSNRRSKPAAFLPG